jgi:hypothetical protein
VPASCYLDSPPGADHGTLSSQTGCDGLHQHAHASGLRSVRVQRRITLSVNAIPCAEMVSSAQSEGELVAWTTSYPTGPDRNARPPVLAR